MASNGSPIGNFVFWTVLLSASAGAFAAGFWYTYGATLNLNTKSPVSEASFRPLPAHSPEVVAKPTASPTVAPGPLPVSSPQNSLPENTPTPMALNGKAIAGTENPSPAASMASQNSRQTPGPTATRHEEIFRVQVGAFDAREPAQQQVDELHSVGINAVVVYDGGAYRAQIGAYRDRASAISVADEVNARGYAVTIRH